MQIVKLSGHSNCLSLRQKQSISTHSQPSLTLGNILPGVDLFGYGFAPPELQFLSLSARRNARQNARRVRVDLAKFGGHAQ